MFNVGEDVKCTSPAVEEPVLVQQALVGVVVEVGAGVPYVCG